jgi:hypothetical protein
MSSGTVDDPWTTHGCETCLEATTAPHDVPSLQQVAEEAPHLEVRIEYCEFNLRIETQAQKRFVSKFPIQDSQFTLCFSAAC